MRHNEKLYLFINAIFRTSGYEHRDDGEAEGIIYEECGRTTEIGEEVSYANDWKGRQILDCCFKEVFGPLFNLVQNRRQWLLEYLLTDFADNPMHDDWEFIRKGRFESAITKWHEAVLSEQKNALDTSKKMQQIKKK